MSLFLISLFPVLIVAAIVVQSFVTDFLKVALPIAATNGHK